jgi:hypothetical protein
MIDPTIMDPRLHAEPEVFNDTDPRLQAKPEMFSGKETTDECFKSESLGAHNPLEGHEMESARQLTTIGLIDPGAGPGNNPRTTQTAAELDSSLDCRTSRNLLDLVEQNVLDEQLASASVGGEVKMSEIHEHAPTPTAQHCQANAAALTLYAVAVGIARKTYSAGVVIERWAVQ